MHTISCTCWSHFLQFEHDLMCVTAAALGFPSFSFLFPVELFPGGRERVYTYLVRRAAARSVSAARLASGDWGPEGPRGTGAPWHSGSRAPPPTPPPWHRQSRPKLSALFVAVVQCARGYPGVGVYPRRTVAAAGCTGSTRRHAHTDKHERTDTHTPFVIASAGNQRRDSRAASKWTSLCAKNTLTDARAAAALHSVRGSE